MSSGNAHQERLNEELDAAIHENAPSGKLEDAEIQRLVELSNDASYQRSERVPVKTVEAFEPRSLVSIAMAAQRRRESELRTAAAAGVAIDEDGAGSPDAAIGSDGEAAGDAASQADQTVADEATAPEVSADAAAEMVGDGEAPEEGGAEKEASSTSQVDFEAGRAEGLEEGHRVGFDEGQAKGMEEGRTAGRAEASAQLERAIQAFESASARLAELTEVDSIALAASINETILRLASERAGRAIAKQPDSFADRIELLLATIRTVSGQPSIRLNPSDLASIQPLAETREKLRHCNFVADPALAHGDLSVMVGTIGVDDIILPRQAAAADDSNTDRDADNGVDAAETIESVEAELAEAGDAAVPEATVVSEADTDDVAQKQDGDQDG
jgi:flagellar assembly protein FliH